ncbi:hypothetical protein EHQ05_10090 [Leptospira yasudae]|uniref:hypothetical protein n=1 Tax=Leptospira yasudae TaxID=2202201 RepID=UPI001083415B|nr:hypothetical protein [Leptospira yasudae]TGK26855.1 hypothetical protein EHQ05_10090 [Leptospira yasudae]TGM04776.1 hypothetical protein EHQ86_11320 [Leptospira yasudae]
MQLFRFHVLEKHFRALWIVSVIFALSDCKPTSFLMGNNPYYRLFTTHPITQAERYSLSDPWQERISSLDGEEQNFIQEMNRIDGFQDSPSPETDVKQWKSRLSAVRQSLPNPVNSFLDKSLFRVILCRNLGGTGLSSFVYDHSGPLGGVVFLDTGMLNKTANDWITQKENSSFVPGTLKLNVRIESESNDTIETALEYILLHEIGHILSVQKKIVPDFREKNRDFSTFEFSNGVWVNENDSVFDDSFPARKKIRFYSSQPISFDSEWAGIYPVLEKTPFPTLYSSINGDDFFADAFVSYVHTVLQKKIWNLEIIQENGKKVFEMKNGIQEPRCKKQKEFLDRLFAEMK